MYAVPSMSGLMTSNTKEQRNNKTTKTTTTAASNQSIKPKNNNNNNNKNNRQKRTNKAKKNTELNEDSRQGNHTRKKIIHFLQICTDIAFNPRSGSCCNAQRYGNNDGG